MRWKPPASITAASPVRNQSPSIDAVVASGRLRYSSNIVGSTDLQLTDRLTIVVDHRAGVVDQPALDADDRLADPTGTTLAVGSTSTR